MFHGALDERGVAQQVDRIHLAGLLRSDMSFYLVAVSNKSKVEWPASHVCHARGCDEIALLLIQIHRFGRCLA
jgi:hypothetical protein